LRLLAGFVDRIPPDLQLATVELALRETYEDAEGARRVQAIPTIPEVPVLWPGGGGYGLACPLAAGDTVLVVFVDRNVDAWMSSGALSTPADDRRHALTDAVAIPILRPRAKPLDHADASKLRLGQLDGGGGSVYALVRVDKLEAELKTLKDAISNAVAVPNDGGAAALASIKLALAAWPGSLGAESLEVVE
jgi:hypothetical protein